MSRSATVPLMLETATIEPPTPASIMACAAARMVSQVPVRFTANTRCHSVERLVEQHARCADAGAGHHPGGHAVLAHGSFHRRRHRVGIADIASDVAAGLGPTPRRRGPRRAAVRRLPARSRTHRRSPGARGVHRAGPINSTSTPSGAVMTAIGTVLPAGAGTLMRRTPSVKPNAAKRGQRRVDVTLQREQEESVPRAPAPGRRVVGTLEDHQFDDAGVGCLRIAKEYRPQPIGLWRRTVLASHR